MSGYALAAREIPLREEYEVIVVGGGPAGCAAATAAAREGARTLLLEGTGCLGGMGTAGLVPAWCPFSDREKVIYRGLAEQVFRRCKAGMPHVRAEDTDWVPIDPELLKRIYDDLVTQAGADVLFHAQAVGVDGDGAGGVAALLVAGKDGLTAYRATVYLDCSGDADVAAWAGAAFGKGDAEGNLQAATHCFTLTNVDEYAYRTGENLHPGNPRSPIYQILAGGEYPLISDKHLCNNLIGPRTVGFNAGHLWAVDNTCPPTVSHALIQGRKMAAQFRDALAHYVPAAFGNAFLVNTAPLLGIRETRRVVGEYCLTEQDLTSCRSFPDEIGRNCYYIDIHQGRLRPRSEAETRTEAFRFPPGRSHGIPYRCLIPQGLRNVLVAGRCISTDRSAQGSTRVMPVCLVTGEAAGVAGALAVRAGGEVRRVEVEQLQTRLREAGGYLLPAAE